MAGELSVRTFDSCSALQWLVRSDVSRLGGFFGQRLSRLDVIVHHPCLWE